MIIDRIKNKLLLMEAKEQTLLQILDSIGGSDVFSKAPTSLTGIKEIDYSTLDEQLQKDIKSNVDVYDSSEIWDNNDIQNDFNDKTLPILFIVRSNGRYFFVFTSGHQTAKYILAINNFYL